MREMSERGGGVCRRCGLPAPRQERLGVWRKRRNDPAVILPPLQLYGVDARDPLTLASVAVLLSVVALGAALRAARLASRIDPMALLRHE